MGSRVRPTVWIVDDSPSVRASLGAVFSTAGIDVVVFETAEALLSHYEQHRKNPGLANLLLLDYHLPGMSGVELLKRLRHDDLDVPAIIITGHGISEMALDAREAGVIEIISKPFDGARLVASVERLFLNDS